MKGIITILFFLLAQAGLSFGQAVKPDLTADEERKAKAVAIAFFTRYQSTKDVTPLFNEFFVSDFARRLEFCRTTSHCQGFGRDFWKESENLPALKPTRNDYVRHYAAVINVLYLASLSANHLARKAQKPYKFSDAVLKALTDKLTVILKKDAQKVFKELLEDSGDNGLGGLESLIGFRKRIGELEALAAALRIVEHEARVDLTRTGQNGFIRLGPNDFWAGDEVNTGRFFDYPVGTKLIDVWDEDVGIPFKVDLIAEKGLMKIVAIYPPMD